MINTNPVFGKVLLFGEHTILRGSGALATVLPRFNAVWSRAEQPGQQGGLQAFAQYLEEKMPGYFQIGHLRTELDRGLYLSSNIPSGYGLGSSGTVCVALARDFITDAGLAALNDNPKAFFAGMESHFHGASSGTDPLISYLGQTLLLSPDGTYTPVQLPEATGLGCFFLKDSTRPRSTATWVNTFVQRYDADPSFRQATDEQWTVATDAAIQSCLNGDVLALWRAFLAISRIQWAHLNDFIPPAVRESWVRGLSEQTFALKLCGAGGGGFCLGMVNPVHEGDWPVKGVLGLL